MTKILDQFGRPLDLKPLAAPQTAGVSALENRYLTPMLDGLTPQRLAAALAAADRGDLLAQHRIFSDMEERDAHIHAEITKRKLALLNLDWDVVPPRNATAAEKQAAAWARELLEDAADPFTDLLLALMDAVGHGFAAVEIEWRRDGGEWRPEFHPRPQEWFRLDQTRTSLRLADNSLDGAPLQPFGWVWHAHGKAKTGYMGRLGLHRVLVWPFIYKAYSLGDFAEFLETFGLPIIMGKYFKGAGDEEKRSLLRAVTALGHDARAIMPEDMQIDIAKITGSGDGTPHLSMIDWAERSESKAILGQTISAEAKNTGLGSGVANLHAEVRRDILRADARQIAGTVTRDLIYPLLALNLGGIGGLERCPRLVFDAGDSEDLKKFSEALPPLVAAGVQIPVAWAHERLKIPLPQEGEAVLTAAAPPLSTVPAAPAALRRRPLAAALSAVPVAPDPTATAVDTLERAAGGEWQGWLDALTADVDTAPDLDALQARLLERFAGLPAEELARIMSAAFALAELKGMADVRDAAGL